MEYDIFFYNNFAKYLISQQWLKKWHFETREYTNVLTRQKFQLQKGKYKWKR